MPEQQAAPEVVCVKNGAGSHWIWAVRDNGRRRIGWISHMPRLKKREKWRVTLLMDNFKATIDCLSEQLAIDMARRIVRITIDEGYVCI